MNSQVPAWMALLFSALSSVLVGFASKWWDHYTEERFGKHRRLTEAQLAVEVERAKAEGTTEGYLWRRIESLENKNEQLRKDLSELSAKCIKTESELEDAQHDVTEMARRLDSALKENARVEEENHNLVKRIIEIDMKGKINNA